MNWGEVFIDISSPKKFLMSYFKDSHINVGWSIEHS